MKKDNMGAHIKTLALSLMASSLTIPAMADGLLQPQSYLSLSAGLSNSPGTCASLYTSGASCSEKSSVYRLGYGYHFTPTWGMEISYGDFGRAKEEGMFAVPPPGVPGGGPIPYVWTYEAVRWEIAATGTLPLNESFSLIGKLGFIRANIGQETSMITTTNEVWHSVSHDDSNHISPSLGVQYDFNRDFALRVSHDRFGKLGKSFKTNVSATYASLILKF